ncbi:DnaJ C-terminal domain-containing protein [Neisseria perflava]|uniref:DnaJ C-terminal domain-containing protein n=1 Tax=Neisseria perflava TaxID=33053 RepID=UPI0020A229B5|nr:DnaJ C-terminal domain-containing protein [Neisseria perflava]MCP1660888.1 curved DNA-binding protein [Neisseria perflava]MCP1773171.1 curved DNA-binding protein [Neisseria perflava]
MADKNYYDILGVAKDADNAAIKKAYRKLVRKYHPDVSKEPDAAERTTEINLAYETLSDKDKRAEYDEMLANPYSHAGAQGGSGNPFGAGGTPFGNGGFRYEYHTDGSEPFGSGDFNFEDLFSSFNRSQRSSRQQQPTGPIKGEDQYGELDVDIYAAYVGAERTLTVNVPTTDAYGRVAYEAKTLNVKIPKGISEGQQIRLSGQGLPGYNGGANGDLYLTIKFHARPDLYVQNKKDVYQTIDVTPWQAVLGGKITVSTAKEPGDLYLNIRITVPPIENEADRAAWQQLADHFAGRSA